jgi:hypothetical protein
MKTFMIAAILSVMSLGHIAEAQDGKSLRKTQIAEQLLASLPTQDIFAEPKVMFSIADQRMISMLPIKDENVEIPSFVEETPSVAQTPVVVPNTQKVEVKITNDTRRIGDK